MTMTQENSFIVAKKAVNAFLEHPAEDISYQLVSGGSDEASIVKCTHVATSYIVKLFSTDALGKNEIAWTQHASDLGMGPKLYCLDPAACYMVIEFVTGKSLVPTSANTAPVIKSIAARLGMLHRSSAPFAEVSDMFARIDAKYNKLNCSGALKNMLENGLCSVKKIEGELRSFEVPIVPCHNDLNPGNVFVNNNQVTLIDWGDAALGNPYYDIAIFFVLNVIEQEAEKLFFEQYDAKLLNPQWQAYIELCKHVVYFEFALNLLAGVQTSKSELLYAPEVACVDRLSYYLTLLAEKEVTIDANFLYCMATAALHQLADHYPR